jgi:hypothetical protein
MSKYFGVVIGAVIALAGLAGLACWKSDFFTVLKGSVPLMLAFAGIIAVVAGISEIRDELAARHKKQ